MIAPSMAEAGVGRGGVISAPRILYVDDDPPNRLLVHTVLSAGGYTVLEAEDGMQGVRAAVEQQPALILLDLNMPGLDGYETAAVLKSVPEAATIPIVALTVYSDSGNRERALAAGCDGFIAKPIDVDRLPAQVAEFLRGKRERVDAASESAYLREMRGRFAHRILRQLEDLHHGRA